MWCAVLWGMVCGVRCVVGCGVRCAVSRVGGECGVVVWCAGDGDEDGHGKRRRRGGKEEGVERRRRWGGEGDGNGDGDGDEDEDDVGWWDVMWCAVVCWGEVWCAVVRFGVLCGAVWCGVVRCGMGMEREGWGLKEKKKGWKGRGGKEGEEGVRGVGRESKRVKMKYTGNFMRDSASSSASSFPSLPFPSLPFPHPGTSLKKFIPHSSFPSPYHHPPLSFSISLIIIRINSQFISNEKQIAMCLNKKSNKNKTKQHKTRKLL